MNCILGQPMCSTFGGVSSRPSGPSSVNCPGSAVHRGTRRIRREYQAGFGQSHLTIGLVTRVRMSRRSVLRRLSRDQRSLVEAAEHGGARAVEHTCAIRPSQPCLQQHARQISVFGAISRIRYLNGSNWIFNSSRLLIACERTFACGLGGNFNRRGVTIELWR